jgi:oxygen-independent coproporphyrinogen III oxidase
MFSLYIHVPFCRRKCPYCDFYSLPATGRALAAYPALLCRHLELTAKEGWPGPVGTVFFGGGTPSLLAPAAIATVLAAIERHFDLAADAEISLEANPGTVSPDSLAGYRAAGVNRLSLGVQSLDPGQLLTLGRLHGRTEGVQAVRWARQAGFASLSLDLIFALPGQTLAGVAEELAGFLALEPDHLSCYGLTAEPDTPFQHRVHRGELQLPDDGFYADAFLLLHEGLHQHGFNHYEIANYARPGHACRHNLGYWQRRPCLGIGAGAHSFDERGWGERLAVPNDLAAYRAALHGRQEPARRIESFDRCGAMSETLYLGLRTAQGVDDAAFAARFGCSVEAAFPAAVHRLGNYLQGGGGQWRLSLDGWLLYDRLIQEFL